MKYDFFQTGAGPQGGERNRSFLPQSYGQTLHYILARLLWSSVETICRPVTPRPLRSLILVKVLLCSGFKVLEAAHPTRRLTNTELLSLFSAPIPVAYKCTSCLTHNKFYLADLKCTLWCHFVLTMCSLQESRWGKVRKSEEQRETYSVLGLGLNHKHSHNPTCRVASSHSCSPHCAHFSSVPLLQV